MIAQVRDEDKNLIDASLYRQQDVNQDFPIDGWAERVEGGSKMRFLIIYVYSLLSHRPTGDFLVNDLNFFDADFPRD